VRLHAPSFGYESQYLIQAHEIDLAKQIRPTSLLQLMQEASMQNAINLKVSIYELEQANVSWVLIKKDLQVHRWPELGETLRILTYPAGLERIFAYRDYIAYDAQDNLVASASSTWTLMNLNTRKVERISKELSDLVPSSVVETLPRPFKTLVKSEEITWSYDYTIRYFDLDWNGHVNNVALSKLMLQSLPLDFWSSHKMERYCIQIKSECRIEEQVTVETSRQDNLLVHRILSFTGDLIAQGNSWWK